MGLSPGLFRKLKKSAPILEKNDLIAVIYGLNFSFKMQFWRDFKGKILRFFEVDDYLSKCPNSKKTSLS